MTLLEEPFETGAGALLRDHEDPTYAPCCSTPALLQAASRIRLADCSMPGVAQ